MLIRRNEGLSLVKLIDFEHSKEGVSEEMCKQELHRLKAELVDTSGRGAGFRSPAAED